VARDLNGRKASNIGTQADEKELLGGKDVSRETEKSACSPPLRLPACVVAIAASGTEQHQSANTPSRKARCYLEKPRE